MLILFFVLHSIVQICEWACEKLRVRLCWTCVFVPGDLSLKMLRCCKPSKRVRLCRTVLQRDFIYIMHTPTSRLYLLFSFSSYFSPNFSSCENIILELFIIPYGGLKKKKPSTYIFPNLVSAFITSVHGAETLSVSLSISLCGTEWLKM